MHRQYFELPFIIAACIFCIMFIMLPHMAMWSFIAASCFWA